MTDRGELLYEYRPPRAHPILYAGFLVFGLVLLTGTAETLLRSAPLWFIAAYAAPLAATGIAYVLTMRGTVRIHLHGMDPGRPLILRWRGRFVRWTDLAAVYPTHYDVTGALVSPFASSDGKVMQYGIGLEHPDGRIETVQFPPARFTAYRPRSQGFKGAIDAVQYAFDRLDRPMVPQATTYTREEADAMLREARAPFLPFFLIVLLFSAAAPLLWLLHGPLDIPLPVALPASLLPPAWVSGRSFIRSRRRNAILDLLSKAAEHEREQGAMGVQG